MKDDQALPDVGTSLRSLFGELVDETKKNTRVLRRVFRIHRDNARVHELNAQRQRRVLFLLTKYESASREGRDDAVKQILEHVTAESRNSDRSWKRTVIAMALAVVLSNLVGPSGPALVKLIEHLIK